MKHSVTVKFIAIILCTLSLVTVAFSGLGIAFMEGYDLYHTPLETIQQGQVESIGNEIAWHHAQLYAAHTLSNAPAEVLSSMYPNHYIYRLYGQYTVDICENGDIVSSEGSTDRSIRWKYETTVRPNYPVVTSEYYVGDNGELVEAATEAMAEESITGGADNDGIEPASLEPADEALARVAGQEVLYSEEFHTGWQYDEETGNSYDTVYTINYYEGPEYEVRVGLAENVLMGPDYMLVTALYPYRDEFIPALLAALVVFAITLVFLCTTAGRNRKGEIHLAAINRIPLDLYFVSLAGLVALLFMPVIWLYESAYYGGSGSIWDNPSLCLLICCLCGFGIALCAIGFLYAFAAQLKASDNYWLRHTVAGWALRQAGRVLRWIGRGFGVVGKALKTAGAGIRAVVVMLPVIWRWLAVVFGAIFVMALTLLVSLEVNDDIALLLIPEGFACVGLVIYAGWCFGKLLKGVEVMSQGNLNHQIDTKYLYGTFRDLAVQLNSLAGAAQLAAERQMKSERMKTELITNVSHDIKTPLTSIINFVDLMKKPHSDAEGEEYLAVLDRQSQRLKKLIDDLMEMSKASTGNMTVELGRMDAAEAVNQALGEFADKLARANLTPVFRHPEQSVTILADGKLLWRILSNLLNNAVKYALPDTRLYIDLMELQGNAVMAIKNISREQLNVNAEELMERFVRGDESRNTEGSGLGLNIAKSLAELQGGQMHLMVDGDLFKVTLIFPLA